MSDKIQNTAANMRDKMSHRYSDGFEHKHNKDHLEFRHHFKSHPCTLKQNSTEETQINESTGLIREFKLRKIRKRLDKGRIH